MLRKVGSPFDDFAWIYERHLAAPFAEWQRPALEQLLFPQVSPGSWVLDVCCGTGVLARQLSASGYRIAGLDSSHGMLRIAHASLPEGNFFQADVSEFALNKQMDAALCVFDSLNHVLHAEKLQRAFSKIYAALRQRGCLVFDINTGAAYGERWDRTFAEVHDEYAFFLRGGFDGQIRIGTTRVTIFRLRESWARTDVEIRQKPWEVSEIEPMLRAAGFRDVCTYRPFEDLGMAGHYGIGRVYFRACR
jgi:ubiquinone/menaquinone biosynthesis C-methylase UbiE